MSAAQEFAQLTLTAARAAALRKLVFSRPVSSDVVRAAGKLVRTRAGVALQIETFYADGKARHENLPLENDAARLTALTEGFLQANLLTTAGEAEYRRTKKGVPVVLGGEALEKRLQNDPSRVEIGGNNKEKRYILTGGEPFLRLLGVSDANGRVYDKKGAKFRQINRFLEMVRDILPHLPERDLTIADLCCGKSYLSFAVYHYFVNILGRRVRMTGVDLKPDVTAFCAETAQKLNFAGLSFVCGDVGAFDLSPAPDLVISLHACDTATDLVIGKALAWRARVVLATPCCQHELNRTLVCPPLSFLAEHSLLRQKFCAAATDALRLKLLEANGYDAAALELIDPDDTPKNILLRAVRRADADDDTPRKARALAEYRAARAFLTGEEV